MRLTVPKALQECIAMWIFPTRQDRDCQCGCSSGTPNSVLASTRTRSCPGQNLKAWLEIHSYPVSLGLEVVMFVVSELEIETITLETHSNEDRQFGDRSLRTSACGRCVPRGSDFQQFLVVCASFRRNFHRNPLHGTDWSVQCLEPTWTNIWGTHDRKIVLFGSLDIEAVWEFLESVDSARFV